MSDQLPLAPHPSRPTAIATAQDAEALIRRISDVMTSLLKFIQDETELVRAGRLGEAARLEPTKSELARKYHADAALIRVNSASLSRLAPQAYEQLRDRHEEFHALLKINLTVLATAHAVSEGIIRGVASEMARKAAPRTYGVTGRTALPDPRAARPVAISRML